MAEVGKPVLPWQGDILRGAFGLRPDGKWSAYEVAAFISRQNGKGPHALQTPILTTDGWTTIGEIRAGQRVYGADGTPTLVTSCSSTYVGLDCYEVEFTDGARHIVAGEHLWHVNDKNRGGWQDLRTDHLATRVGGRRPDNGRMEYRYRVRCDAVPETPDADLPIDPWLLGFWLGDGSHKAAGITSGHGDLAWVTARLELAGATIMRTAVKDHGKAVDVFFRTAAKYSRSGFLAELRNLGVYGNKHIPEVYLAASPKQRTALLAGLMDSDGSIASTNRSPQVEFCTAFPMMAETFLRLARSLGIRVARRDGPTSGRGRSRFLWTPTFDPFQMPRKSQEFRPPTSRRHEVMSITAIRRVPSVPTRCIEIERPDGVYLVGHLFTPTHNCVTEAQELFGLYMLRERKIIHSAHLFDTSREAFGRIAEIVEGSDWLMRHTKAIDRAHGKEGIRLMSSAGGGELKFKARTLHGARGFSGERIILDEAYALTTGQFRAISPILATLPNPQITYTSSPPDDKTGPMPEDAILPSIRRRGAAGDPRMAYYEWSPASKDADGSDPDLWYACNPSLGYLIDEEFLESQYRIFAAAGPAGVAGFATEHLGAWPDEEGPQWSVVGEAEWHSALDPESTERGPLVLSIDSTPERDWTCISSAGRRADGDLHAEVVDYRPGMDWAPARIAELVRRHRPPVVSLVGTAAAYALHPDIVREITLLGLLDVVTEVKVMTNREVAAAFGLVVNGLTATDGRRVRIRPGPHGQALADAVRGAVKRDIGEGSAWDRGASSVNISLLVSLTNAVHTYASAKIRPPVGAVRNSTGPAQATGPGGAYGGSKLNLGGSGRLGI